jgi:hypothetical protein
MSFAVIDAEELKAEVAKGKGDGEILVWINEHARNQHTPAEIAQWSTWREQAVPTDTESREFFNGLHKNAGPEREDIATWPDVLDLDDYVSFGGKA